MTEKIAKPPGPTPLPFSRDSLFYYLSFHEEVKSEIDKQWMYLNCIEVAS